MRLDDPAFEAALAQALARIEAEVRAAARKHAPFNSPHEGYAVLLEEVDELWTEVKSDRGRRPEALMEAVQVGAMAVRYLIDCGPRR